MREFKSSTTIQQQAPKLRPLCRTELKIRKGEEKPGILVVAHIVDETVHQN
jgi:hypothetical protein